MTPRLSIIAASIRKAIGGLAGDIGKYADEYWNNVVLSLRGNTPVQDFKTETVLNMHMDGADPDWNSVVLGMHMGGGEVDPYWSSVSALLFLNGSDNSTAIGCATGKTVTVNGNSKISTAQSKFGGASLVGDGSADYLSYADHADFNFGSGDFTIECWARVPSVAAAAYGSLVAKRVTGTSGWSMEVGAPSLTGAVRFRANFGGTWSDTRCLAGSVISANTWFHYATVRNGNTLTIFIDGKAVGTQTVSGGLDNVACTLRVGGIASNSMENSFNGNLDNVRITKGVARYTDNFTPPNREFPTGATTIYDVKGHPVTVGGSSAVVSTQSRFGGYSCYLPGSPSSLAVPSAADLELGAGNFTIEFWVNLSTSTGQSTLLSHRTIDTSNGPLALFRPTGTTDIKLYLSTGSASWDILSGVTVASGLAIGVWHHIAVCRSGSSFYGCVNGVVTSIGTSASTIGTSSSSWYVGSDSNSNYTVGYIDDLRITKGVARYTAAFTPPSRAFPHDVPFFDEKGLVPTVTGAPTISTSTLKYGYGSASFNGTTDYLTFDASNSFGLATGDFTIEAWVKTSAAGTLIDFRNYPTDYGHFYLATGGYLAFDHTYGSIVGTTTVTDNTWHHVAFVRYKNILTLYVDGADSGAAIANANIGSNRQARVGAKVDGTNFFSGNIDELRVTKVARYVGEFTPQKYEYVDANNNKLWQDETGSKTVTAYGNAVEGATTFRFGNGSMYFDGAGDYLTVPDNVDVQFGSSDFTIEAWVQLASLPASRGGIVCKQRGVAAYGEFSFFINSSGNLAFGATTGGEGASWTLVSVTGSSAISLSTMTHVAVTRNGSTFALWKDGAIVGTATASGAITTGAGYLSIGADKDDGQYAINAYIDDLRITKGVARYTSAFTPPSRQNPNYGIPSGAVGKRAVLDPYYDNVVLNMHMNGPSGSTAFVDEKGKKATAAGNAALSSTQSKFGGVSAYFDGTGDCISTPYSSDFDLSTGDFTVEAWFYKTVAAEGYIVAPNQSGSGFGPVVITTTINNKFYLLISYSGTWAGVVEVGSFSLNTWTHVAATRLGNTATLWVNGVSVYTYTISAALYQPSGLTYIGGSAIASFTGYIDDVRITKGVARYTGPFTLPSAPNPDFKLAPPATDPYWKNVVLHMPMNGADAGTTFAESTGKAITVYGDTKIKVAQYRFGGSSAYFDGTGDYLSTPSTTNLAFGTGDYTIEAWVYLSILGSDRAILDTRATATDTGLFLYVASTNLPSLFGNNTTLVTGSTALAASTWYHLAVVKSAGTITLYLNGLSIGSAASAFSVTCPGSVLIGRKLGSTINDWYGYIDDLRITKGVARYTAAFTPPSLPNPTGYDPYAPNVVLHLPMATDFNDSTGKTVTVNGNTVISTTVKKLGAGSGYFDGSGDYLSTPTTTDLAFDTGDYTVESWVYLSNLGTERCLLDTRATTTDTGLYLYVSATNFPSLFGNNAAIVTGSTTLVASTWYHLAAVKSAGTVTLYLNGVSIGTAASAYTVTCPGSVVIGRKIGSTTNDWNGYLSNLRITKGVARYTANFTPPREPFSLT